MSSEELGPFSQLVAVRKVVWNDPEFQRFYNKILVEAIDTFGGTTQGVRRPKTLTEPVDPDALDEYVDVTNTNADIFALRSLRVVLFSRRAPSDPEVDQLLANAHIRLKSNVFRSGRIRHTMTGRKRPVRLPNPIEVELKRIEKKYDFTEDGPIPFVASSIENISPTGAYEQIYALKIDAGTAAAKVLIEQQKALEKAASGIQAVKKLRRYEHFARDVDPLAIVMVRYPGGLSLETERFEEVANYHKPVHGKLEPVGWRLKTA